MHTAKYYCEMFSVCVCIWIFLLLFFSLPKMVNKVEYKIIKNEKFVMQK